MDLLGSIHKECCTVDLKGKTKDDVLRAIAELACRNDAAAQVGPDLIFQHLKEREAQGTTGFGNGVALPHARIEGLSEFVIGIAASRRGVEFAALDKKKCNLIFFIVGPPEATADHLKALAGISRQVNSPKVRTELIKSASPTALYESFARRITGGSATPKERRAMKLILVVLYMEELLYEVLQHFIEQGIDGATILDGAGMGQYISNVPLFAEFIGFMRERKNHSQTIMALIPADQETRIVEGIEAITGDMDTTQGAMVMTLDVSFFKGTMRMM
jgi:nitrogen PTS system EIIA component